MESHKAEKFAQWTDCSRQVRVAKLPNNRAAMELQQCVDAEAFHRFSAGGFVTRDGFLQAACASEPAAEDLAKRVWSNMKDDTVRMSEEEWDAYFRPHLQCFVVLYCNFTSLPFLGLLGFL